MKRARPVVASLAGALLALGIATGQAFAAPSGPPIRIGSTLSLTGPLSGTAIIHKLVGEIYVEQLNKKNGLLGRPVEWIVKDDQSKPDLARTLYEQLITVDKVDLVIGPYATPNIVSAMGVAQRYNKMLVHHTMGIPSLAKYDMQFPAWSVGPNPEVTVPNTVLDALATLPKPPRTVAIVTSKFPSVYLMSKGAQDVIKKRGLNEVLFLEWEFGNRDYGAIANRVKDAKPDFVWVGAIGLEGNLLLDAMKKIDYVPPLHFYMYPAPGPLAKLPEAKNALAASIFEQHPPFTDNPVAAEFVKFVTNTDNMRTFASTALFNPVRYSSLEGLEYPQFNEQMQLFAEVAATVDPHHAAVQGMPIFPKLSAAMTQTSRRRRP